MGLVVVAESDANFAEKIPLLLTQRTDIQFISVPTLGAAEEFALSRSPHVLVIGPSIQSDRGLKLAQKLAVDQPETAVVLIVQKQTTEILKQALKVGIKDVLSSKDSYEEIGLSIKTAYDNAERFRLAAGQGTVSQGEEPAKEAKVITIFSTKGGVGKSVISTNLATALAGEFQKKTIILDLDLQFGDVAIMLQLVPERTVYDVVQAIDKLDAEMLKGFFMRHSSGLDALLAPLQPEEAACISSAHINRIIAILKQLADYIIIDTPSVFNEIVLTALDKSDAIYAVATMDVPSIKNVKVSLQKLAQLGYSNGKVGLVLNRADSKVWLQPSEVEKVLERKIIAEIPSDRSVPRSVNKGIPIVIDEPKSLVTKSLVDLAALVTSSNGEVNGNVA